MAKSKQRLILSAAFFVQLMPYMMRLIEANEYFVLHSPTQELSTILSQRLNMGSPLECASWCATRNDCMAYSYGQTGGTCKIGSNATSSLVNAGSSVFYKMKELSVKANGSCITSIQCTGHPTMACIHGSCQCQSGWYASTNGTSCLKSGAAKAGDTCTVSTQCSGYPSMVCATNGQCSCLSGSYMVSSDLARCLPKYVPAHGSCERSDQCNDYPVMTCTSLMCECNSGWVASSNGSICLPGDLAHAVPCTESQQCFDFPTMFCSNLTGACACPSNTVPLAADGSLCLPVRYYGQTCEQNDQCPVDCIGGICDCGIDVPALVQPPPRCIKPGFIQIDISDQLPYNLSYPDPRGAGIYYEPDLNLAWCVETVANKSVKVQVIDWDVEGRTVDYIELHEGCHSSTTSFHAFDTDSSGNWMSDNWTQTTTDHMMGVNFVTDSSMQYTGFTLTFTTVIP